MDTAELSDKDVRMTPTRRGATAPARRPRARSGRAAAVLAAATTLAAGLLGLPAPAGAAPAVGEISTVAGALNGRCGPAMGTAVAAGTLYVACSNNVLLAHDLAAHDTALVAGAFNDAQSTGDGGPASDARLAGLGAVAVDGDGNVYLAEDAERVRRIDAATHDISTIAGGGAVSGSAGDGGLATDAALNSIYGMTVAPDGALYLTDHDAIRRVDLGTGVITTVAGETDDGGYVDGAPGAARFHNLASIASAPDGALYVSDFENAAVRRVDAGRTTVSTVLGGTVNGNAPPGYQDGDVATALAAGYGSLAVRADGSLLFADLENRRVRVLSADGTTVSTLAGDGTVGLFMPGVPATSAGIGRIARVALDASGRVYLAGESRDHVMRVGLDGTIEPDVLALDGVAASKALLAYPLGMARVGTTLYVADIGTSLVRSIDLRTGTIATFAALDTIALATDGTYLYAAGGFTTHDARLVRIRLSDRNDVTTIAGTGVAGLDGDGGPATAAHIVDTTDIALGPGGRLYFTQVAFDHGISSIRCIGCDGAGIVSTVAGTAASQGFTADGEVAAGNVIFAPYGLTIAPDGAIVFTDTGNGLVRRVDPATNVLTTLGGTVGDLDGSGDGGLATSASFADPIGVRYDTAGNLFVSQLGAGIAGSGTPTVRRIDAHTKIVTRYAGGGSDPGDGGAATDAQLLAPFVINFDGTHAYVVDVYAGRVRRVQGALPELAPSTTAPTSVRKNQTTAITVKVTNRGSGWAKGPIKVLVRDLRHVSIKSLSAAGWTCVREASKATCTRTQALAPGASRTFKVYVKATGTGTARVRVRALSDNEDVIATTATKTFRVRP